MRSLFTCLVFLIGASGAEAQDSQKWIVRLGATGTGTSDEGVVLFSEATGLGAQAFEFSNSWGVALNADRALTRRLRLGVHAGYATTDFTLKVATPGGGSFADTDQTTMAPLLLELKLSLLPDRRANPHIGFAGGMMFAKNVRLRSDASGPVTDFTFENPPIGGYVLGVDLMLDAAGSWLAFFQIKSLTLDYTVEPNSLVPGQTLLDQRLRDSLNHLVLGVGYAF